MVIIYDGENLVDLVGKLRFERLAILNSEASPMPNKAIYFLEKNQEGGIIRELPSSWYIEMEVFDDKIIKVYPDRVFTRDFVIPKPLGRLYVQGSLKGISSLCRYLLNSTRISFGISGDKNRTQGLKELGAGRIEDFRGQPLHLILDQAGPRDRQLYIWEGSLDELYDIRDSYEELPRYHYLVQRGFFTRSFHSQRIIHGRYLGRVSKRGFDFEWKKILGLLED